jgi:hypothetical protein
MNLPEKYNLYEQLTLIQVDTHIVPILDHSYYVSSKPLKDQDSIILEDLCMKVPNGDISIVVCVVKRIHHRGILDHYKIAKDFDVCSPVRAFRERELAEKFAKKEFGRKWNKSHSITCFRFVR